MAVNKFRWQRKSDEVYAVHWNGTNQLEVEQFFDHVRWAVAEESGPYFPDEDEDRDSPWFYNTLQFYCYDDHEVDENTWLVISRDSSGSPLVETMSDDEFYDTFERPTD